jgi:CRP/FNR family transcriptional regulator, cyclic AMP receptor protein
MSALDQMLIIRENQLFSQISDEEYEALDLLHHFKETPRNQYIYFEAFHHNKLYFLKEGYVKIGYFDKDGNEVIKEILGKGDIFGQIVLERGSLEGEFAQAYKADVSLCAFKIEDFEKLLVSRPELSVRFTRQVGQKLARVENRMINLLQKDVRTRLLYFMYSLTRQYPGSLENNAFELDGLFTHDDIAKLIGSSRQTVTTLINRFQEEGLLSFNRGYLKLPDVNKLQKVLTVI